MKDRTLFLHLTFSVSKTLCSIAECSYITYLLQVRRLELALLKRWLRKGLKPVDHSLVSDVTQFVKVPSDL